MTTVAIHGGTFDSEGHLYRDANGLFVPSLTQVLKLQGLSDYSGIDPEVLENAARRGTEVHELAAAYNTYGEVDPSWITDETRPYFEAYLAFMRDTKFKPDPAWSERAMIVNIHNMPVGLTPDCFGRLGKWDAVVEIKAASAVQPSWSVQTGLQEMGIFRSNHVGRVQRFALQLFKNGNYKLHPHTNHQEDEAVGIAALRLVHWRINHKQRVWEKLEAAA